MKGNDVAKSELTHAGQRQAQFMAEFVVSGEGVARLLKGLNPSNVLGSGELYPKETCN